MNGAVLVRRVAGAVVAVTAAVALRWGNASSLGGKEAEPRSQLRLSFTARPERIERCIERTDEELARLPAHMRLRTECEGFSASYLLAIHVGDRRLTTDTLRGGGLRHDRPLHVLREHDVSAGAHRLRVEVTRLDEGPRRDAAAVPNVERPVQGDTLLGGRAEREREERARRAGEAIPPRLLLDTLLAISPGRVVLITIDSDTRRLVARMEP